jgi:cyanophycinase
MSRNREPADEKDRPRVDAPVPHHSAAEQGASGTLVLIGGASTTDGRAFQCFLELAGAHEGGRIVGLTTASTDPEQSARLWRSDFRAAGARNVDIPLFRHARDDTDTEIAARIRDAQGVFLGGGDQVKLVAALSGSLTCGAIRDVYSRGGVVCGTSAGAAALTELTMAGGEVDEEGNIVEQYIGPGLGLLGYGAIIDTHFSQRRRLQRLFVVIGQNTELFGLGIDENTVLVVRRGIGEVLGAGGVTFVDGRDTVRYDNARDLEKGRQLTLSHLRLGIVGTHHRLDLGARELCEALHD